MTPLQFKDALTSGWMELMTESEKCKIFKATSMDEERILSEL